ncbi:MAG: hypothetical protein GX764_04355 [Firmicutes bacterium]|nr:hypothetical protein [Bacillota bacterium]
MRQNYPSINPVEALPRFILTLNPWFSGLLIATMLITVIGAAAGITLGVSTIVTRDIYQKIRFNSTDRENIFVSRCVIILILIFALFIALSGLESFVLYWSYYALGLRGAALFIPLLVTLFKPDVFLSRTVNISMILAAFTVFMWGTLLGKSEQSIYIGLMVSFAILLIGFMRNRSVGGVKEVKKG